MSRTLMIQTCRRTRVSRSVSNSSQFQAVLQNQRYSFANENPARFRNLAFVVPFCERPTTLGFDERKSVNLT